MKILKLLGLTGLLAVANTMSAQTYFDLTDYYLVNATFDTNFNYDKAATGNVTNKLMDIEGWTKSEAPSSMVMLATFEYGTAATAYKNSIPATGQDGKASGGCLAIAAGLGNKIAYHQKMTLAPGKYMLITATYNAHATANSGQSLLGWIPEEGEAVMSTRTFFDNQKWVTDTIRFEISQATKGHIQIGYQSVSGVLINSGTMPLIDFVKLMRDKPYDENIDVQGDAPTVKTDKRFARGATMAFGRMTATIKDGTITERGFCWSESPEPTINDYTTTETLSNNGTIYWLKDLKPATMYYMRAYAKTEGRQVGYGEVIKFCTVPKGNVSYSYNNGGDAAANERVNNAATEACEIFNNLTCIKKHFNIGYSSGTPTADCYYADEPWMNMGANSSYQRTGTIMHEMQHGLGLVPYSTQWNKNILRERLDGDGRGSGHWLGDRVSAFLDFWDNTTGSQLNGDFQHMWPYGINGASEDNGKKELYFANAMIGQALGEDGLEHRTNTFAEPCYIFEQEDNVKYYLKNENENYGLLTGYLTTTANGKLKWQNMSAAEAAKNDSAAWYITFTPNNQYYQFHNAATGQYLTYSNEFKTIARTNNVPADNFHLMKGRVDVGIGKTTMRGYWIISPSGNLSPKCLNAGSNGLVFQSDFDIRNSSSHQRWLILNKDEMEEVEQSAFDYMKGKMQDVLTPLKALINVPHTENENGVDNKYSNALNQIEQATQEATTTAEFFTLPKAAYQAAYEFLCKVTATDAAQPFDLTYLILDPGLDRADRWEGTQTPTINYSCAEFFEKTFDFYQEHEKLPGGYYIVKVQGFQRPGTSTDAYNNYAAGRNTVTAFLYAGNKNMKIAHIAQDAQSKKLGGKETAVGSNMYIPNDMQAASLYFKQGLYENTIENTVEKDGGSLKFGLRSSTMSGSYWVIFDNFRLYFLGKTTPDMQGITTIEQSVPQAGQYYDLQGRRVVNPTKGIYIVGNKKVKK